MRFFYLVPGCVGAAYGGPIANHHRRLPPGCEIEIEFWSGDALVSVAPWWILATEAARDAVLSAECPGAHFEAIEVFKGHQFFVFGKDDTELPVLFWMNVQGKAGQDDFGIASNLELVVSERALKLLQSLGIPHAKARDFKGDGP
jgi:hypothetical protein